MQPRGQSLIKTEGFELLEAQERLELLEKVRSGFDQLSNADHWLNFLERYLMKRLRELNPTEAKLVMRILEHAETASASLEQEVIATLRDVPNLAAQKIGLLGAIGSGASLKLLEAWDFSLADTPFLRKQLRKAVNRLQRRLAGSSRVELSKIQLSKQMRIVLNCVEGMEPSLEEEVKKRLASQLLVEKAQKNSGEIVCQAIRGGFQFGDLIRSRLFSDAKISVSRKTGGVDGYNPFLERQLLELFESSGLLKIPEMATSGTIRFAVRFEGTIRPSGSQLASFAGKLETSLNELHPKAKRWLNDPRQENWQFLVSTEKGGLRLSLKLLSTLWDTRFSYRTKDIPAASHPTVAALLASLVGELPAGASVMDPFCGSGLELIETGLVHPDYRLIAGDIDATALAIAKELAGKAGVKFERGEVKDALGWSGLKVDCVVTNPPFGRRAKAEDIVALLEKFIEKLPSMLKPGGRLVWISPQPKRTKALLEKHGFVLSCSEALNLGGIKVALQVAQLGK